MHIYVHLPKQYNRDYVVHFVASIFFSYVFFSNFNKKEKMCCHICVNYQTFIFEVSRELIICWHCTLMFTFCCEHFLFRITRGINLYIYINSCFHLKAYWWPWNFVKKMASRKNSFPLSNKFHEIVQLHSEHYFHKIKINENIWDDNSYWLIMFPYW